MKQFLRGVVCRRWIALLDRRDIDCHSSLAIRNSVRVVLRDALVFPDTFDLQVRTNAAYGASQSGCLRSLDVAPVVRRHAGSPGQDAADAVRRVGASAAANGYGAWVAKARYHTVR